MASNSATTAPKGRATRSQSDDPGRAGIPAGLQWTLVILATIVVIGGIFYFGRNVRSDYFGGGGHSGAPAPAEVLDIASN